MRWCMIRLPVCVHRHTQTAVLTCWAGDDFALPGFKAEKKRLSRNWGWGRTRGPEVEWERALESVNFHHPSLWLRRWHTETSPDPCRQIALVNDFSYQLNHTIHPSILPYISLHHPCVSLFLYTSSFPHWVYFPLVQWSTMPVVWWIISLSMTHTHTHMRMHTHILSWCIRGCTWGSLIGISNRDMPFVCNCTGLPWVTGLESDMCPWK